ncbi:MAG: glycosyltransferase family A protein [Nostoc sp.]
MQFSLILATKNRVTEVERFLRSLATQSYTDFEVIVVDQNRDDRLVELIEFYSQKFSILHLKQLEPGLSRARNLGRSHIKGDLVAFPDDDCLYPPELLAQVVHYFENSQTEVVIARAFDIDEDKNAFLYCGDDNSGVVDLERAFRIGITFVMFFHAHVVKEIAFDETIGPGSGTPWGCGEDMDYLFKCVKAGYNIYYNAQLIVRHPNPFKIYNFRQLLWREYSYGRGNGYLMGNNFPASFIRAEILPNLPYVITYIFQGRFDYSAYVAAAIIGMSLGYWDSVRQPKSIQTMKKLTGGSIA